jgi:dTDP-4-amino-4,6-dideoxygalactose transaminase
MNDRPTAAEPFIPFHRAWFPETTLANVRQVLESGRGAGDGPFTRHCEARLAALLDAPRALLTTSCTDALEMAALLLNLQPGDEVIVPSFTFVSTANAFVLHGAQPVFADIRPDTLNLDPARIERLVTGRTRAVVAVHYAGIGCDMDQLGDITARYGIPIIEDNAHGLFGTYRGKSLGTFGPISTLSFHETKNITCGEGGALILNDPTLVERAEILREKGTNRSRFFRGDVDKYSWVDLGSSYLPADILAAVLAAQLDHAEEIQHQRRSLWTVYETGLAAWAEREGVRLPTVPEDCHPSFHLFYLVLPSAADRSRFLTHMRSRQILSVFHYQPLHQSRMGLQFGGRTADCPVTERIAETLVRLPLFPGLTPVDQERIVSAVTAFRTSGAESVSALLG